ncbi:MlaD family protein [Kangiella shandongensis]|uniref:MlaD family protein n=1 Tax=Kangiella shandongensis TaxID=2763258 RepID=UPI001CBECA5B|nr:MlaD family protein [Kangiella shandongensis]
MSNKSQSTAIGGFVLGAIVLFIGAVMFFAKGSFNDSAERFVMFFDGSLAGLDEGAPVVFKGVKVGVVKKIEVVTDSESLDIYTPVYVDIYPDSFKGLNGQRSDDIREVTSRIIEKGLKGTLETQSLVTGKMRIALEFRPDVEVRKRNIIKGTPELPTAPSALSAFADEVSKLPLADIASNMNELLKNANQLITETDLQASLNNLNQTIEEYGRVAETFNREIKPVAMEFKQTMDEYEVLAKQVNQQVPAMVKSIQSSFEGLEAVLTDTQQLVQSIDHSYGSESELQYQLSQTLQELSKAAHSIRVLTDYIERHPEALIYGKDKQ